APRAFDRQDSRRDRLGPVTRSRARPPGRDRPHPARVGGRVGFPPPRPGNLADAVARVLVTGGAGFVGSHVADAFVARGDDVLVVDDLSTGQRENVPENAAFELLDVADAGALEGAFEDGVDVVC